MPRVANDKRLETRKSLVIMLMTFAACMTRFPKVTTSIMLFL